MTVSATTKVALITTSTRNPRVGPHVSKWVRTVLEGEGATKDITLSDVDLVDFNLPIFDESIHPAMVPAMGSFTHDHSKAWSAEIAKHDAYIFVIPEYNLGMSGGTKNAIDYLYNEWTNKPVLIITYGIYGGRLAGEQLAKSLGGMKVRVVETRPSLAFTGGYGSPDMMAAAGKGELGETSTKDWEALKPEVVQAFDDLKQLAGSGAE